MQIDRVGNSRVAKGQFMTEQKRARMELNLQYEDGSGCNLYNEVTIWNSSNQINHCVCFFENTTYSSNWTIT